MPSLSWPNWTWQALVVEMPIWLFQIFNQLLIKKYVAQHVILDPSYSFSKLMSAIVCLNATSVNQCANKSMKTHPYFHFIFFHCHLPIPTFFLFYQIFSLFTFQMLSPFLASPQKISFPLPASPCSPTHPLLLPGPGIPLCWGIEPSQDQGPLLPLMTDQANLCNICKQSHESHHVFSLIAGLVPGSSGGPGWFILLFLLGDCKPLQLFGYFLQLFHWGPCAPSNGWL